jgi:glycogen operon protein
MAAEDWDDAEARCLGMLVSGQGIPDAGPRGEVVRDDDFLLLLNAHHDDLPFVVPESDAAPWRRILDSAEPAVGADAEAEPPPVVSPLLLQGRSVVLLQRHSGALPP